MIVIVGKNGQLAKKCAELLKDKNVILLGRKEIDITSKSMSEKLDEYKPTRIINASAYTAVDSAETEKQQALDLNYHGVKQLSEYCKLNSIHFVHVSTDYVFKGDKGSPYKPTDIYDPINAYGKSKMLGEKAVLLNEKYNQCVLRTSWVYSEFGANFLSAMLKLMETKEELGVIYDQIGTPTSVNTLAKACIASADFNLCGVHHVTDEGIASWYDFAKAIQEMALKSNLLSKQIPIKAIESSEYPSPTARPHYSVLCKKSLQQSLPELILPYWRDALSDVIHTINASSTKG